MRQLTFPRALCAVTPAIFVSEANIRSVPTAMSTGILKRNTRIGVISDPPPTPVSPTIKPTTSPTIGYSDCKCTQAPFLGGSDKKKPASLSGSRPTDCEFNHPTGETPLVYNNKGQLTTVLIELRISLIQKY